MRLSSNELQIIKSCFQDKFEKNDHLWLFGSRVDDKGRGGDIDLYIETHSSSLKDAFDKKFEFILSLNLLLGEQKIDIILNILSLNQDQPIYKIAKETGLKLV